MQPALVQVAASKILGPRKRQLTDGFLQLVSHYLFKYHFCPVRGANEKGLVEGLVKLSRLNFLVPVPRVGGFEELNTHLLQTCREDMCRKLRAHSQSKEKLLLEETSCFLPLPFEPFDACRKEAGKVNSQLLVRFGDNDYAVPMEYAYRDVTLKGYTDRVEMVALGTSSCYRPFGRIGFVKSPIGSRFTPLEAVGSIGAAASSIVLPIKSTFSSRLMLSSLPVLAKKGNKSSPTAIDISVIASSHVSLCPASPAQRCCWTQRHRGYHVGP